MMIRPAASKMSAMSAKAPQRLSLLYAMKRSASLISLSAQQHIIRTTNRKCPLSKMHRTAYTFWLRLYCVHAHSSAKTPLLSAPAMCVKARLHACALPLPARPYSITLMQWVHMHTYSYILQRYTGHVHAPMYDAAN